MLQQALVKDPLNRVLVAAYAINLQTRGDAAGARNLVEGLLRLQPDYPNLLVTLSTLETSSGNLVAAWRAVKTAYDQAPENTLVSSTPSPELTLEANDSEQQNHQQLSEALEQLDDRSKTIVTRRWLNDSKATLHELADEYGVSAERIRQIEKNAFKSIKATFVA